MIRKEFKEQLFKVLDNNVDGMSFDEKMNLVTKLLIDYEKNHEAQRDISNKGKNGLMKNWKLFCQMHQQKITV